MLKQMFYIAGAIVIIATLYSLRQQSGGLDSGVQAPGFSAPVRDGVVTLSQYEGKVVLLNFWATWCPPCRAEMPSLEALKKKMEGRDFQLLAISEDEGGWPAIDRFLRSYPVTMTVALDARGDVANLYESSMLPTTFLIDKKGQIVRVYTGPRNWTSREVLGEIEKLLAMNQ